MTFVDSHAKIVELTPEIKEKEKEFNSLMNVKHKRLYTVKPNNLFGLKGGMVFTGLSLDIAVEKVIDDCFRLAQYDIEDMDERIELLRKIKSIAKAITLDNIIIGLNGKKRSDVCIETVYDVEKDDSTRYSDLCYDKKLKECYYYELDKKDQLWIN